MLPDSFVKAHQEDWICEKCARSISHYEAHDILERIENDLLDLDYKNDVKVCKTFLATYTEWLTKNHFFMTDVKNHLVQLLGRDGLERISEEDLTVKLRSAQELVELIKIIAPAECRSLGVVLFETHAAFTELARRKATHDEAKFHLMVNYKTACI